MYDADYPKQLKKLDNYAASPELPSLLQWKPAEAGHALVWKTTKELFVGVAVVQVYNYRLNCGPNGNFINPDIGNFVRSKFQFYCGRPSDSNFSEDYLKLFSNLEKLQQEIAVTKSRRDMLFVDASGKMLRFAKSIFAEREKPLKRTPHVRYYEDVVNPMAENEADVEETIDDKTNNWPVDDKYKEALDEIKFTHRVLPLRVYKDNEYVEPRNVNNLLRNSLVEVLFSVHHTFLRSQVPTHDTFRANIEQIIIHKQQQTFDETSYSKTNIRAGPVSADTFNVKHQRDDENEIESRRQKIRSLKGKEKEASTSTKIDERSDNRSVTLADDTSS